MTVLTTVIIKGTNHGKKEKTSQKEKDSCQSRRG